MPCHVVVTIFDLSTESVPIGTHKRSDIYPDVYDMKFAMQGGKVWLLKQLTEYAGENRRPVATAAVRDVKLVGPSK